MKFLGRLIMFVVGGFLLYLSISSIISGVQTIKSIGWENFFTQDTLNAIASLAKQIFYALSGLYAIYIGLRGKAGFIAFVAAAILIVIVVLNTISFIKSDNEKTFKTIFDFILSYLVPIGFSVGTLLLIMSRDKK